MAGLDHMMNSAMKLLFAQLGITPEMFAQITQIVVGTKGQLDRIERNQMAIMAALNIPAPVDPVPALENGHDGPNVPGSEISAGSTLGAGSGAGEHAHAGG